MDEVNLEERAEAGDTEAQCALAFLYEIGVDRPQDFQRVAHFWQMAAKAGRQLAVDKLQQLLDEGKIQAAWLDNSPSHVTNKSAVHDPIPGLFGTKVLMADDEVDIRALICEALEEFGIKTIQAENGEEGVQKILANPDIKLIITDLKMPKMNGLQMIKTLRRMQVAESARIIVMTSYTQASLIAEGKKLNVDAWLVKPVRQDALIETIKRLLERKTHVA